MKHEDAKGMTDYCPFQNNQAEKLRELLFFESAEKKKTRKSKR